MDTHVCIKFAETTHELEQILKLQAVNYVHNLSISEKKSNGFVTLRHDIELLKKMNKAAPQVIAIVDDEVVGYALVMLKEFYGEIPLLGPMFDTLETIDYKEKNLTDYDYYVMGQICIAQVHRGKGIFEAMYGKQKERYSTDFELCLTEVSVRNIPSLRAHAKVGFQQLRRYRDSIEEWDILGWEIK